MVISARTPSKLDARKLYGETEGRPVPDEWDGKNQLFQDVRHLYLQTHSRYNAFFDTLRYRNCTRYSILDTWVASLVCIYAKTTDYIRKKIITVAV